MRVIVCGSRNWTNYDSIYKQLEKLPKDTIIVHGAAKGADSLADKAAKLLGLSVEAYEPDWELHGKAAGPMRNIQMLKTGIDKVLAFTECLTSSKGTKHMVSIAKFSKVPVEVFNE